MRRGARDGAAAPAYNDGSGGGPDVMAAPAAANQGCPI